MAGLIPQSFIDDLLDRVDLVELIDRRVPLKKSGRNYMARCPFHDEKTPSFSVNPDKQFYYCFGCGATGNAIGFLMDYERAEFPQAVEDLASVVGLEVPRERPEAPEKREQSRDLYAVLDRAAAFYREQLRRHPSAGRAVDYLKQRGLSGAIARDFDLGYAPPGWDNLLRALATDQRQRQLLIEGGLLVVNEEQGKCYDRFRDRIIFPIRDSRGRVIAFGGRVLGDDKPKYLNSPETPVFHKNRELYGLYQARQARRHLPRLVVVEGYMDVVALAQFGLPYAVATLGTATSTDHLKKLFRHSAEVVFCFDGDAAGRQAAERALHAALPVMEDGRQVRFLFLPEGDDPDTLVRRIGADAFERELDGARPLEDFLFEVAGRDCDTGTMEGRARLGRQAAPLLAKLPTGMYRQLMLDELARRTGLGAAQLDQLLLSPEPEPPPAPPSQAEPPAATGAVSGPRRRAPLTPARLKRDNSLYALGLLTLYPRLAQEVESTGFLTQVPGPGAALLAEAIELLHRRPETTTPMLLVQWLGQPEHELLARAMEQACHIDDEAGAEAEFSDTLQHLKKRLVAQNLDSLVDKLRSTDYSQLTPEEKLQLRQLLGQKHSK